MGTQEARRVCLVTGGSSGVGRAVVRALLRAGATVVVPTRNPDREGAVVPEAAAGSLIPLQADLARLDDVRALCGTVLTRFDRLDLISGNAGLLLPRRTESADGFEMTFAVGFLAHFLMVRLLTDRMLATPGARVLLVSGTPGLLRGRRFDLSDLQSVRRYSAVRAAVRAAVAKVLLTQEIARRYPDDKIKAYTFHPGAVRSGLGRHLPVVIRPFYRLANLLLSERCPVAEHLAVERHPLHPSGQFLAPSGPVSFAFRHIPEDAAAELWRRGDELCGIGS